MQTSVLQIWIDLEIRLRDKFQNIGTLDENDLYIKYIKQSITNHGYKISHQRKKEITECTNAINQSVDLKFEEVEKKVIFQNFWFGLTLIISQLR